MRAHVIVTSAVFALLVLAHVARLFAEGWHVAGDPWFFGATVLGAVLSLWGWVLVRRTAGGSR